MACEIFLSKIHKVLQNEEIYAYLACIASYLVIYWSLNVDIQ